MATLLLSAAGAAIGAASGVSAFGLSGMVLGRAIGATIGYGIDRRLLASGTGSEPVEHGRMDRFRFTNAAEGAPVAQLFGRMRLGGQVIWATQFVERTTITGGGGGGGKGGALSAKAGNDDLFLQRQPRSRALRRRDLARGPDLGRWRGTRPSDGRDARLQGDRGPDAGSSHGGGGRSGRRPRLSRYRIRRLRGSGSVAVRQPRAAVLVRGGSASTS